MEPTANLEVHPYIPGGFMFRIAVLLAVFAPSVSFACGMKRPPVQVAELTLADAFDAIDVEDAAVEEPKAAKPAIDEAKTTNAQAVERTAEPSPEPATADADEPSEPAS
jgi:hypothetical protein